MKNTTYFLCIRKNGTFENFERKCNDIDFKFPGMVVFSHEVEQTTKKVVLAIIPISEIAIIQNCGAYAVIKETEGEQ